MRHAAICCVLMFLCLLCFGCTGSKEIHQGLNIDIKENFETPDPYDDIDYTIQAITFTTGKAYDEYTKSYSKPGVEVCLTIKNNKSDQIEPLMKEAVERIRLFHRGVECTKASPLLIRGKLTDYMLSEKYILPEKSFNACMGFGLETAKGLIEASYWYKAQGADRKINHVIANAQLD